MTPAPSEELALLLIGNEAFSARPGGLNRYLESLAHALREEGTGVRVVASSRTGHLVRRAATVAVEAHRASPRADVVDCHFAPMSVLVARSPSFRRTPCVVHFQGPWADETAVQEGAGRISTAVRRGIERAVYRRADRVVTLSTPFRDLVVDRYGVEAAKVAVIPPGVDVDRFAFADRPVRPPRLGLPDSARVVVAARRLVKRTGIGDLVEAWPAVAAAVPGAVLLVAGDGPERPSLEQQAAALGLGASVRFLGRVSDEELVSLYQAADVSAVPTRSLEGFGLVVLESLACGTPAVVTDVGGLREAVAPLDRSLVVAPGAPAAMAERLALALGGEVPSRRACRAHAERHGWAVVAQRHLDLYRDLLRGA